MIESLSLFGSDEAASRAPRLMSENQRRALKELFAQLGVATAKEQFDVVREVTGEQITSPTALSESAAQALILRLRHRVSASARPNTGDLWADREEDTWIDKL